MEGLSRRPVVSSDGRSEAHGEDLGREAAEEVDWIGKIGKNRRPHDDVQIT